MSTTTTPPPAEAVHDDAALLDVAQVAVMLHCSTRHVQAMTRAGRMPGKVRLGGAARWRRRDLMAWIEAGCPRRPRTRST